MITRKMVLVRVNFMVGCLLLSGLVGMKGEKINSMTRSRVLRHHTLLFCAEANGTVRVHSISIGLLLMVLIARSRTLLQLFIEESCSLHPERE